MGRGRGGGGQPKQSDRIQALEDDLASALQRLELLDSKLKRLDKKVSKIGGHGREKRVKKERKEKKADEEMEGRRARKPRPPATPPPSALTPAAAAAPPASKRKRQDSPASGSASSAESEPAEQSKPAPADTGALALYNPEVAARRKRGRPKKIPAPPAAPPPNGQAASGEAAPGVPEPLSVPDPKGARCCYNALGVSRSATPDAIKRAFRRLALQLHPDKPTGNAKAFVCANKSFEVLMDPDQRAAYDLELRGWGSQDGLERSAEETTEADVVAATVARPDMVAEMLLFSSPESWQELISVLAENSLPVLATFLRDPESSKEAYEHPPDANLGKGGQAPGIRREGSKYRGKITCDNLIIFTFATADLAEAVDGRIALVKLKMRVNELRAQGQGFDDACRIAVKEIRSSEQVSAFFMYFSFEYKPKGGTKRYTTPRVVDLDEALRDRAEFLAMGSDVSAVDSAHHEMMKRVQAQRKHRSLQREQLERDLFKQVQELLAQKIVTLPIAPHKRFQVVGPRRLGVLGEPRLDAEVLRHLEAGETFFASRMAMLPGSQSKFYGGAAEKWGWVPEFSRKDPTRRVVIEVLQALEDGETEDEMGSNSGSDDGGGGSSSSSSSSSS